MVCLDENDELEVYPHNMAPDVLEKAYNDHVALLLVRGSHARWDTPRGRYDEYNNKFSLRKKLRLSNQ